MSTEVPSTQPVSRRSLLGLVAVVLAASLGTQWWATWQEQRLGREVAALARPGDILMVASETCVYCHRAREWMTEHRVPFRECMIETDEACRAEQARWMTPVTPLMLVRGQMQPGFSPQRIHDRLAAG